jgi:hypothetical protein
MALVVMSNLMTYSRKRNHHYNTKFQHITITTYNCNANECVSLKMRGCGGIMDNPTWVLKNGEKRRILKGGAELQMEKALFVEAATSLLTKRVEGI